MERLSFEQDGAVRFDRAALSFLDRLHAILAPKMTGAPGSRLYGIPGLGALLSEPPLGEIPCRLSGLDMRPVRAILFDKTAGANWSLGWHQDRTIAVRQKVPMPGFERWTCKTGVHHVEPPFTLIERMITLRIHLDPVPADNAPLLIAPGSHRLGLIGEARIQAVVEASSSIACLAESGDVWAYATPILHASARATGRLAHRRVLQVDYSAESLPHGLTWLGV